MGGTARLGPAATDRLLNTIFRGVTSAPPTSIFFSLGIGATANSVTELAGSVRTERLCNRGEFGGTNSVGYFYQSSGTGTASVSLRRPLDISLPSGTPDTFLSTFTVYLMGWLTSTGGEPYFWTVINPTDAVRGGSYGDMIGQTAGIHAGDIIRFEPGFCLLAGIGTTTVIGNMPAYTWAMYADYLFRGIDSFSLLFPIGTYPDTYMSFGWAGQSLAIQNYSAMPWLACPRNTATWTAPADYETGVTKRRYITNSVALTTSAATAASWSSAGTNRGLYSMHIGNSVQAFDEAFYRWADLSLGQLTWATGDQITFPANSIQIVMF